MGHPWRGSVPRYPMLQQLCEVGQRAMGRVAPRCQQEPGMGPAEPAPARTTLEVGVMNVPFSAAAADCATPCSVLSGSGHRYLCCCLREQPAP